MKDNVYKIGRSRLSSRQYVFDGLNCLKRWNLYEANIVSVIIFWLDGVWTIKFCTFSMVFLASILIWQKSINMLAMNILKTAHSSNLVSNTWWRDFWRLFFWGNTIFLVCFVTNLQTGKFDFEWCCLISMSDVVWYCRWCQRSYWLFPVRRLFRSRTS